MGCSDQARDLLLLAAALALALLAIARLWELVSPGRDSYVIHNQTSVRAFDGLYYRVHSAHAKSSEEGRAAADMMARLSRFNIEFLRHIRDRYTQAAPRAFPGSRGALVPPPNAALRDRMKNLLDRYNPDVLNESSPFNPRGDTSFTIAKGKKLAFCLRDKQTGGLTRDPHTLEFVVLHELAHIAEHDWGHKRPFWVTFKWVLYEGKIAGLHEPADYAAAPRHYCGLDVGYQPFTDASLAAIWAPLSVPLSAQL